MNTSKEGAQLLANICLKQGVRHVIIAPGSRSAPLVIAFTAQPQFTTYSIADERVAGYFAMGIAQKTQQPVAIVCTSGTAVLNLAPAVCEAFYQGIPLIVVSADRPKDAAVRGDNQALIDQHKLLEHFTAGQYDIQGGTVKAADAALWQSLYHALDNCRQKQQPIHINIRFEEPLYETAAPFTSPFTFTQLIEPDNTTALQQEVSLLQKHLQNYPRKLLLIGLHEPDSDFQEEVELLAQREDVVILADACANVHHPNIIRHADAVIEQLNKQLSTSLLPDMIITLGRQLVSKRLKNFFRQHKPTVHYNIEPVPGSNKDVFNGGLIHTSHITEKQFLQNLLAAPVTTTTFAHDWQQLQKVVSIEKQAFLTTAPFTDVKVFETLIRSYPAEANIQYGNSTPIRYAEVFQHAPAVTVNSNRGTSGIDGCVSTAAGAAIVNKGLTICVVGDVSFLYDSNALWNHHLSPNLRIIILNNGGGNIFRWLDGPQQVNRFEKYFETAHHLTMENMAKMYGLGYYICASPNELNQTLERFYLPAATAQLLEIKTKGPLSAEVYRQLMARFR